jgi:hypothetical protein
MPRASTGPDIDLYGSPPEVRHSQRLHARENDLESDEMVFSSLEIENASTENELGEQSFSDKPQNILLDLSQQYREKLAAAENEKGTAPFSFWETTENEILCPKPVLKPLRVLTFQLPVPSIL